jgi:DNA repair protein RAD7
VDRCSQLGEVSLAGCFLCTDEGLSSLADLPLKSLSLKHADKLGPRSMKALVEKCGETLESLTIESCPNLKESLSLLSEFKGLKLLHLKHIGLYQDDVVCELIEKLGPQLDELSLNGYPKLTDKLLETISVSCGRLQKLSLEECPLLTSQGFQGFLSKFKSRLTQLSLRRNVALDDQTIIGFLNHHGSTLTCLNLNGLDELTSHSLTTLASSASHLEMLDASWIRNVDDEFLEKLISTCPNLKRVKVYGCNRLTDFLLRQDLKNAHDQTVFIQGNEFD